MIAIVDYQVGNTGNVRRAFEHLGEATRLLSFPNDLTEDYSLAVLPGVGAYGPASERLLLSGWGERLGRWVKSGGALLGICLGMQLLCKRGLEDGIFPGLGLIPGEVLPLEASKIPHMGWNTVEWTGIPLDFTPPLPSGACFYFVHSFALFDTGFAAGLTTLEGKTFTSMVIRSRVAGFQFHPERSGPSGLTLLQKTADYIRKEVQS